MFTEFLRAATYLDSSGEICCVRIIGLENSSDFFQVSDEKLCLGLLIWKIYCFYFESIRYATNSDQPMAQQANGVCLQNIGLVACEQRELICILLSFFVLSINMYDSPIRTN